ncbi:MAG: VWA domain-containing protein [Acidobacteriia bacterium]|nr:VWA domain-containing protein [Terriglobia bacterium]
MGPFFILLLSNIPKNGDHPGAVAGCGSGILRTGTALRGLAASAGLFGFARKTELLAASLSLVFLWGVVARRAPLALAQDAAVFRAGVQLVRVDAQVVDGRRVLGNLTAEDFQVFDEGVPQTITYFGRDTEPLWVLLLLDVSGSMHKRLAEMAVVARKALGSLGPQDRVSVVFFGRRIRISQEFTTDLDFAADAIGEAASERSVGSGTAINPSILEAASYMRRQAQSKPGRRAIVILTDNGGLNYQVTDERVLEELLAADAVLNAIVTQEAKPPGVAKKGVYVNPDFTPSDVFHLARQTGGEILRAERAGDTFREMMERIRTRYSLHYRSPQSSPGQVRKIRVELSAEARKRHARAEVRARSGYRVPD